MTIVGHDMYRKKHSPHRRRCCRGLRGSCELLDHRGCGHEVTLVESDRFPCSPGFHVGCRWGGRRGILFGRCFEGLAGIRFDVFVLAGASSSVFYGCIPLCRWEVQLSSHSERARAKDMWSTIRSYGQEPKVCGAPSKAACCGGWSNQAAVNTCNHTN